MNGDLSARAETEQKLQIRQKDLLFVVIGIRYTPTPAIVSLRLSYSRGQLVYIVRIAVNVSLDVACKLCRRITKPDTVHRSLTWEVLEPAKFRGNAECGVAKEALANLLVNLSSYKNCAPPVLQHVRWRRAVFKVTTGDVARVAVVF